MSLLNNGTLHHTHVSLRAVLYTGDSTEVVAQLPGQQS